MTKLKLTLIAITFFGFAQAQSFKISAGYGFPSISQQIGTNTSTTSTTTLNPATNTESQRTTYTTENIKGSYGSGLNIGGAYVYEFSKNLNLELGLSYVMGRKYTTESFYHEINTGVADNLHVESEVSKSRAFLFTPMLKFIANNSRRPVTPYFFAGPVVSKVNYTRDFKRYVEENSAVTTESRSTKFRGGLALGVRAGAGVNFIINKKLSFFSEISFTGMNYYPKESEITRYIIDGEDNLSSLTQNVRKTIYVNKLTTDSEHTSEEINSPGKSLRFPVAMSSIALNVGVLIKPKF